MTDVTEQLAENGEPGRRLSFWRLTVAVVVTAAVIVGGAFGAQAWASASSTSTAKPWFASYVDVTATPTFAFEGLGTTKAQDAILSFVVSSKTSPCTPTWGAADTMDQASANLDLDRRIARLQQRGGSIAVSFGGQQNQELAVGCTDSAKLLAAYQSVLDRYKVNTIDLDLEGSGLTDPNAAARRATAIAALQKERRASGGSLAVWLTLPVSTTGLDVNATDTIATMLSHGVDIAGVNAMTMDFGQSRQKGQSMVAAASSALTNVQRQLGVLYTRAGTPQSSATLWQKIGVTPMIGQNDDADEVFTLAAAKQLNAFARNQGVGRVSMWSANRDETCGPNYVDVKVVSDACSGVDQKGVSFASVLSSGFNGRLAAAASLVTRAQKQKASAQTPDNPKTSPYQIWSTTGAYLQGTKVVWHHNVYQAKWWTQGDVPDDPVLNSWETPWELIGPVLPGEKPIKQATLPAGFYPDWSGTTTYTAGERVLFEGVPYEAKWWNQAQSPATAASDADNSPWIPLTQSQIGALAGS
ncbi:chitinase [Humibacter sp. RRB41]|uniref:chitinase n=1 Tax=Humibacter sp. RRB41 TaxID=2919946 RepID=UPI001FA95389|nr:chitinase [Humibacter sp. RRB41]